MRAVLSQPGGPFGATRGRQLSRMGTSLRKPRAEGQAYLSSIALWVLDCESRGPIRGNPADPVQRPLGFPVFYISISSFRCPGVYSARLVC